MLLIKQVNVLTGECGQGVVKGDAKKDASGHECSNRDGDPDELVLFLHGFDEFAVRFFTGYPCYIGNQSTEIGSFVVEAKHGNETINVRAFRSLMQADLPATYFDWTVRTGMGEAHFIATAPNAWSSSQAAWLDRMLAVPATYTFVIAHETPTDRGPGSLAIEEAVRLRPMPVTLRMFGHFHTYRHLEANAIVVGNAGAPLSTSGSRFGFTIVEQRADGNIVVTAYTVGHPPMVEDTFVLRPDGTMTM